ncbi:anucleate primary sterigmata protein A, partial [Magnaporthiopsis poae ATCC 64411]
MANPMASSLPFGVGGGDDPFVSVANPPSTARHLRYSTLDSQIFSFGPGTSAEQAKRALQAHLLETNRKLEEVGKSGTALVEHRRQIEEQMKEVEQLQAEEEVPPGLKKTLVDLERDYSEVTRETSRTLLPKQRVPSNEAAAGSPFAPEGKGGRRSVSPSKFESQATGSPTKLSVPNRKLRNQPANRIHDIEFAAEISTSLISQVRNLQSLLAERDEELRDIKLEKSRLELDAENFQQRVKSLDENEHRYKDENWNLETQLHELIASQKEASEREKKLTQALNVLQAEKNSTQRELDEIKVTHSKLVDEHAAAVKHHDIELGTVKRNMVMAESERSAMQRKIDDLTSQNQELAKAFSAQRGRTLERDVNLGMSDEDFETGTDNATPEHSPPPSPVKGTPRHPMLESETLKTSLHHAQRTIQSLRANNHREKTEKLELKRIVQDLRDEMERMRGDPSNSSTRRNRKVDSREFKKPLKPGQLGGARTSRSDICLDDPDWEDQAGEPSSPTRRPAEGGVLPTTETTPVLESSDHFETAHETSDGAF